MLVQLLNTSIMKAIIKISILFCFLAAQLTIISAQNMTPYVKMKRYKTYVKEIDKSLSQVHDSLYASKYELSNLLYRVFFFSIEQDLKNPHHTELLKIATVDSNVWSPKLDVNEPMTRFYFRHPAYNDYPVVGVSHEAAKLFCTWLTDKYNSSPKRKFKKVLFRLPTEKEWELAAGGGRQNADYPWGGPYLRNSEGRALCNYQSIGDENIIYDSLTNKFVVEFTNTPYAYYKNYFVGHKNSRYTYDTSSSGQNIFAATEPVASYFANNIGLYNIAGNVAEMVNEKGISRGGSWKSPGGEVQIKSRAFYSKPTNDLGFRFFMEIIEK